MQNTKKRFALSLVVLLICICMLIGTTFAWFSDSISSGNNRIMAGNLDIEMYWTDNYEEAQAGTGTWYNIEDPNHDKVFDYDKWEPGYTELRYIKIKNNGNLALKYKLGIGAAGAVGKLAEVIDVYYIPEVTANIDTRAKLLNIDEDTKRPIVGTLKYILENQGSEAVNPEGKLMPADATDVPAGYDKGETVVAIAFKMQEEAGNEYQNESIGEGFYITAVATQIECEEDSFDNLYDENAYFPVLNLPKNVSEKAELDPENKVKTDTVLENGTSISAVVPSGVEMVEGTKELVMTVKEVKKDEGNITADDTIISKTLDVHVEGVASTNTKPILVKIKNAVPSDMNRSAVVLYHTEKGEKVKMTSKASLAEVAAHNDYYFDTGGNLTMALAHFSEILLKVDASNPWDGEVKTNWYNTTATTFTISTAEQLAGLAELVNGGNDFAGKTVVLDKSIVLNNWQSGEKFYTPEELHNDNSPVYYPSNGENAQKNGGVNGDKPYYFTPIGTDANPFKGTFNGDGHFISGLYRIHYGENNGYDDARIGVFGCVDGATVKNLTVKDGFVESFGGLVGVVAATAKGNSIFDNIKIRNNYILTYNEYLGGVVGYYGDGTGSFKNISVDNTNNFGALWGTYDLPCGGIIGGVGNNTNINLTDSVIFPSMDLYNDCCANYQWFNYRYSGMLVGYLPGSDIVSFAQSHITCSNVSVHYGEWTSQYYCELRSLGKGSYNGETEWKYTKINRNAGAARNCGYDHAANNAETTTWRGVEYGPNEAHEDHCCVNIAFHQLFGGGQGVKGVEDHDGVNIVEKGSISVKFKNTDKYLYRVGNRNTVALDSLFEKAQNTPNIDSNAIDIAAKQILGVTSVEYVKDTSDWTKSTLKFSGEGVTALTLYYANNDPVKLNLEVVDGYNVTAYNQIANRNSVLLNDITMSSGGKYYLSNATLYGNGFKFDVTAGAHGDTEKGNESGNYVIGLLNANLDNVQVIGKVYTTYGATTKADYNFPCVLVNGGDCVIANSYISNCASPIRARGGANLLLKNTTLKGGSFCNLDVRGGVDLTIDGLTTINQVNGNDAADNGKVIVGLGILLYYEGPDGSETITILGDGIKQYNYVASDQKSYAVSIAQNAYDSVFNIDSKFKYNDDTRTWVNTGILSIYEDVGQDSITTPDGYEWYDVSMLGKSGHLCTQLASNFPGTISSAAPGYQSDAQYPVAPSYSFEYPTASGKKNYLEKTEGSNDYCYWDSSRNSILIGFEKGDTFSFDPDILTVTKFGEDITPVATMNGQTYKKEEYIDFTESGEYTVNYTYSDPYNYDENGNVSQSVEYTKMVNISAIAADKTIEPATFDFNGKGYKQVTGTNSVTYVMPNIDDSNVDGLTYVKKTVGGQTVYYPVVCVRNGSPSTTTSINGSALGKSAANTALVMVFDGIVTITDNGNTYGSSNTNMADGKLSAVESGLKSALVWQSANSYDTVPDVVSNKQCFKSASIQGVNRTQTGYDVEYIYRDDAGKEYHYFVKYVFPAKGTGTNAYYQANATFTVTVNCGANGTVDNTTIKGVKYGTALTSDLNKLMNGTKVIATATPNEKYAASWSGLTDSVTKDTTVTLKFVKECTLTINCGEGGTVNTQTITGISEGAKLAVDGNKLLVNGAVVATATPASGGIANWSIPNTTISDDMTVDLTFVTPVTITITAGDNGSVSPTSVKVAPGKKLTSSGANLSYDGVVIATATASSGYDVYSWSGVPSNAITADTSVSISFNKQSSCIIPGTLITMADGTQKPVEKIKSGDIVLTWNLNTGTYGAKPVVFNDFEKATLCDVIYVTFSDGTEVGVVSEHGFFDMNLGKYVYLDKNAAQYIGHSFIKQDGRIVTLTNVKIKREYTKCYSPTTFGDLCYYTNGMLSMPGGISGLFNIFDVDTKTMKYNKKQMQKDIKRYGLLDIDDFGGMITEDMFNAFNGKYLGVAIGKGNLTWEYIKYLAERYAPLCK